MPVFLWRTSSCPLLRQDSFHRGKREDGTHLSPLHARQLVAGDSRNDLGATEQWKQKTSMLANVCRSVSVSTVLEDMATDEQRARGLDIADFLLMEDTPQMILQRMIDRNPVLQTLIDELGLELVDAEQI
mgnify:CR=1 FL=1